MTADDFVLQPRARGTSATWRTRAPISTPFGAFEVEIGAEPDSELVASSNLLAGFVTRNIGDIYEAVYAHYQRACEDAQWMRSCGVPRGLRYDRVAKHVRSRTISIRRRRDGTVAAAIFLVPEWDTEHGIELSLHDGRLAPTPSS